MRATSYTWFQSEMLSHCCHKSVLPFYYPFIIILWLQFHSLPEHFCSLPAAAQMNTGGNRQWRSRSSSRSMVNIPWIWLINKVIYLFLFLRTRTVGNKEDHINWSTFTTHFKCKITLTLPISLVCAARRRLFFGICISLSTSKARFREDASKGTIENMRLSVFCQV